MKYVIHQNIDLRAVVSLAILGARPEEIFFAPAGAKELPEDLKDAWVVVDHLGEQGQPDPNGVRHVAAVSLPEAVEWPPELLAEVYERDSGQVRAPRFSLGDILAAIKAAIGAESPGLTGEAMDREVHRYFRPIAGQVRAPRFSLGDVLAAIKAAIGAESPGLTGEAMDREVYRLFRPIAVGLKLLHRRREEARRLLRGGGIRVVDLKDGLRVAVLNWRQSPVVGVLLNEELGCSAQIYSEGYNLGVFRYPGRTVPDLRRLANKLPGWFIHPAGFLAAWGTKKSPATSWPPDGTPQNREELLELLVEEFGGPR
jgi:hypothetical protein